MTDLKTYEGLAVSEAFDFVPETLPKCPDGSGDLWWDDASYIRYQSWDPYYPDDDLFVLAETLPSRRVPGWAVFEGLNLYSPDYRNHWPNVTPTADDDGEEPPF